MSDNARRPSTWVTWLLIAANVAMFAYELGSGLDPIQPTPQDVLRLGGDFAPLTLHGEWWRVGTSMFLHYGLMHIAMNMICLWQARIVEMAYGHLGMLALYLVSGLLGGVGSVAHNGAAVSAGASGAVFGVFGAFGALLVIRRSKIDPAIWSKTARQLGTFIGINLVIGLSSSTIDITAHIVGLIVGFLAGAALLVGKNADNQRVVRAIAALVLGIAATGVALAVVPEPPQTALQATLAEFDKVEHDVIERYNAEVRAQKAADHPDSLKLADLLDHDILPKWRAEIGKLAALPDADVPPALKHRIELLRTYADDRRIAWEEYAKLLRSGDATGLDHYHALEQKVRDDLAALKTEITK